MNVAGWIIRSQIVCSMPFKLSLSSAPYFSRTVAAQCSTTAWQLVGLVPVLEHTWTMEPGCLMSTAILSREVSRVGREGLSSFKGSLLHYLISRQLVPFLDFLQPDIR
jgi:hypothetical protein